MKIIVTAHQFLPDHSSGTEIIAYNTAKELQSRGHDVTVVTGYPAKTVLADDQRFDTYEYDGLPVVRFLHAHIPMGGQDNVIEAEYHNRLFHRFFKNYLKEHRPDVVHFIHLGRLTSSAIDACVETGIPAVFTATDFWFVCPTNQLKLPDGRLCTGPKMGGANCVKHIVQVSQPPEVQAKINRIPMWMLGLGVWAVNRGVMRRKWFANYVRSLSARPGFLRRQAQKLEKIIVPSHIMGDMLVRNGLPREKVMYLPYGIDVSRITRREDKGSAEKLRVSFTGTLFEHKGVHVLVKAVRSLPPELPVELKIHGKTTEFPAYVEELRNLIGDDRRIELCGPYKNHQLDGILGNTDVLVCPSIWYENTPLVIYEANAAGVPVLATNLGGMAESVQNGVNGLLFEPGDHVQLAGHLRKLAQDRPYLRQLASKTKPPLSVPDHVTQLEALYTSLLPIGSLEPAGA